jgi:hypothetical protein
MNEFLVALKEMLSSGYLYALVVIILVTGLFIIKGVKKTNEHNSHTEFKENLPSRFEPKNKNFLTTTPDRYGRWHVTFKGGDKKTVVGNLSKFAKNSSRQIEAWCEIK